MSSWRLAQPLTVIKGIGPKAQERLQNLGITTVGDVLFHFPLRFQDKTAVTAIGGVRDGEDALVSGTIEAAGLVPGRRRSFVLRVSDQSGIATVRLFHFSQAQIKALRSGATLTLFGQGRHMGNTVEFVHPEYRIGGPETLLEPALTPVYPTVEGVGQPLWRRLTAQALIWLKEEPPEDLLAGVEGLRYTLSEALSLLHRPPSGSDIAAMRDGQHPAQHRLALEELVAHHLSLRAIRRKEQAFAAPVCRASSPSVAALLQCLPFTPTAAQTRVSQEIHGDLQQPHPMLRLVQGDVGSGKTLVAAIAALHMIDAGYQVALMAPTELLAEQHLRNFQTWLDPLGVSIAWLSGRVKGKSRRGALEALAAGTAAIAIGTHALFQDEVQFQRLGLVIVDEQHRFGVHQRLSLTEKGVGDQHPHQLVLTATPIPRTLSMVAYADLDCSVIDELPPGRKPITTTLMDNQRRDELIARLASACQAGRQAYWVCTLIEENETLSAQAAEVSAEYLRSELPPELTVGLIHGRLAGTDKERIMADFKAGNIDVLVATTVIEVGVDVPNASLMIIENPERLGLAQLHQLRGRVGRGQQESFCVLLYQAPLSQLARSRLQVMRESTDGFYIAEQDLHLRGPGELLGTRQTGLMSFRVAQLPAHEHLLEDVQHIAERIEHNAPSIGEQLILRWTGERRAFARV